MWTESRFDDDSEYINELINLDKVDFIYRTESEPYQLRTDFGASYAIFGQYKTKEEMDKAYEKLKNLMKNLKILL